MELRTQAARKAERAAVTEELSKDGATAQALQSQFDADRASWELERTLLANGLATTGDDDKDRGLLKKAAGFVRVHMETEDVPRTMAIQAVRELMPGLFRDSTTATPPGEPAPTPAATPAGGGAPQPQGEGGPKWTPERIDRVTKDGTFHLYAEEIEAERVASLGSDAGTIRAPHLKPPPK